MKSQILHLQNIKLLSILFLLFFLASVERANATYSGLEENPERTPVSWTISRKNDQITIQWDLHGANQIVRIEIERTIDQKLHQAIDTLPGQRKKNYAIYYTFSEGMLPAENQWFRLKMTDSQKRISYSPYVLITPVAPRSWLSIRPSPNNGSELKLIFSQPLTNEINVTVQDMQGRTFYHSVHRPANELTIRFNNNSDIPALAPGVYQVMVDSFEYSARETLQVQ